MDMVRTLMVMAATYSGDARVGSARPCSL